jgi:cell division protein FtsX
METETPRLNKTGGVFAAMIFLFVFGFFVGLPIIVWVFLVAAFIGLWVATSKVREVERQRHEPESARPWRK